MSAIVDYPDTLPHDTSRHGYFWHHFWGLFYEMTLSSLTKLEDKWQPSEYTLVAILNFIFALIACILLLNFLIAMMARTFQEHAEDTWVVRNRTPRHDCSSSRSRRDVASLRHPKTRLQQQQ